MRPYLRAANVGWSGLKLHDVKWMNFTDSELFTYRLAKGDILLAEASGSADEVGKPAMWVDEIEDCCFQNTLIRVRPHSVDSWYLFYFLKAEARSGAFVERSRGVGINHLGSSRLEKWIVPLPPIGEQRRIVQALEELLVPLDRADCLLVRQEGRVAATTEALVRSALAGIVDNILVGGVLERRPSNGRSVPTADEGFPVLRLTALRDDRVDLSARKTGEWTLEQAQPYLVKKGDVLLSRGNGSIKLVGRAAIVYDEPGLVAYPDTIVRLAPDRSQLDSRYLVTVWNSRMVRDQIEGSARTTAGIYKINRTVIEQVWIPLPSLPEQVAIVAELDVGRIELNRLRIELVRIERRIARLRRALHIAAFNGELVDQDPTDEPASALLAHIRAEREAAGPKPRKPRARKATIT